VELMIGTVKNKAMDCFGTRKKRGTTEGTEHTEKEGSFPCVPYLPWFSLFDVRRLHAHGLRLAFVVMSCFIAGGICRADEPAGSRPSRPLLIAFSSFRDRPAFASLYLYRHDGVSQGEIMTPIPPSFERGDTHASLTADGKLCLYTSKQVGGFVPLVQAFDVRRKVTLPGPEFNAEFAARTDASVSGDGRLLTFCAWDQPGHPGGWDVLLYDRQTARFIDLPGLNSESDEREAAISGDGRWLAFLSNRPGGAGLSDVWLYDRSAGRLAALPGLNSPNRDLNPSLSADGALIAFVSDRPGGAGGKDILLYDREKKELSVPAGLNSVAHEQTPAFSPDGRFLVFVSERTQGAGERDLFLYDRKRTRLLPVPGLNSAAEDFDPCIAFDGGPEDDMMRDR
jgi:WD40-like Beta Propeller Repeat